jgi:hypothetical protein
MFSNNSGAFACFWFVSKTVKLEGKRVFLMFSAILSQKFFRFEIFSKLHLA